MTAQEVLAGSAAIDKMREEIKTLFLLIRSVMYSDILEMRFTISPELDVIIMISPSITRVRPLIKRRVRITGTGHQEIASIDVAHQTIQLPLVQGIWERLEEIQSEALKLEPMIERNLETYVSAGRALAARNAKQ